jgi:inner membrane protein
MDPLSHVAVGRTLAGLSESRSRGYIAATVLGSLAPDIDVVLMPFGWDRYLRFHESGTHTILGTLACAFLVGGVVRIFRSNSRYVALTLLAWMGALSHVVLDLVSSARHRIGWPFIDTVVSFPAVAMADPWLLGICAAGAATVIALRASPSQRTATIVLAAIAAFLMVKAGLGARAIAGYRTARDARGERVNARVIEATWASLNTWNVLDRTPSRLRFWRAHARHPAEEIFSWPLEAETPIVRASRSLSTVRNFLHAHALAFAVSFPRDGNRTLVLWSDIRFCWNPDSAGAPTNDPIVEAGIPPTRLACALWFGGEFDARGTPVREIVRIGRLSQERGPAP